MIIDIAEQIGATSRKVEQQHTERGEVVAVTLQRRYPNQCPTSGRRSPIRSDYAAGFSR